MTAYNCAHYLKDSISSILAQTYGSYEFLIIDDGSTDETSEILSEFSAIDSRIINLRNERNCGISHSLNMGLEIAKGRYVARMDADDVSFPERIEKQVRYLKDRKLFNFNSITYRSIEPNTAYNWHKDRSKISYHIPLISLDFSYRPRLSREAAQF